MGFQWFSCIGMCATILEFIVQFFLRPWHPEYIPMFGNVPGFKSQALVVGTVIFSCAFTITIPSWANEKQPHVSVNKSVWSSAILSMIMKIAFAYLAAITYRNDNNSDNILSGTRHFFCHEWGFNQWLTFRPFFFDISPSSLPFLLLAVRLAKSHSDSQ